MLEREVLKACLEFLRYRCPDWLVWRQNQGAIPAKEGGYRRFVGLAGVADILCVFPGGRFGAIEVKRPGGKTSPAQEAFLDRVSSLGGVAIVASSVEELETDLREAGVLS